MYKPFKMKQMYLCDLVNSTKTNRVKLYELLLIFDPLLIKYARLLDYTDSYNDLQEAFFRIVSKMDTMNVKSDGAVVNYIRKAVYNQYISLSKSNRKYTQSIVLFGEPSEIYETGNAAVGEREDEYSFINKDFLNRCLTNLEYEIIDLHYYKEYSIAEIALAKNVSRQAINQTKKHALRKLRKAFEEMRTI